MINILLSRGILGDPAIVEVASEFIKKDMKVCVIYLSFFDFQFRNEAEYQAFYQVGGEYHQKLVNSFLPYQINETSLSFINYYRDTTETMLAKINNADIIYFPGGSPDQMMKRIINLGLYETLAKFDKIVIGSSAGAMIQNDTYHISIDKEYHKFCISKGLGYIKDFGIEVHFRRRKTQKKAIRKITQILKRPLYTICDDGCLIVTPTKIYPIRNAKLYYTAKGKAK